jgi:acetylornithine deacetylase/succinyl-diaminopimelate desuccinylase-like protein
MPTLVQLKTWYEAHFDEIKKEFFTFLSFPSISTDPAHAGDVRKTAEWLRAYLAKIGMQVQVWETAGHPVLFATHLKAGPTKPTLLLYHHYDVQPVDPIDLWQTPPFEATERAEQIFARGASDNKGQCFYTLCALKAFFELSEKFDVNIKLFIEGEEECGSRGSTAILAEKQKELKADHLLVVDFDLFKDDVPAINLGIRGLVAMEIECSNAEIDLHSGTHGGVVLNPNRALAQLLAKLWDAKGAVAVPHFYDGVRALSVAEEARIDLSFDAAEYQRQFGVKAFAMEEGMPAMKSNWLRPTIEINGMWGGYTGEGFKTVIPAKAFAKLSCRLVADQNPGAVAKAVEDFLRKEAPAGIELKVRCLQTAPAYRVGSDSGLAKVVSAAYQEVFGTSCRFRFCGGSVPIVSALAPISQAETAMIGCALPEDDIHAPNEHFAWKRFRAGFLSMGRIFSSL